MRSKGYELRRLGEYDVPIEALNLQRELACIEVALGLLKQVSAASLTHGDTDFGEKAKWVTLQQIKLWQRTIERKLKGFLASAKDK